ncbi:MAG: Rrf2 family transcriptional regulator [Candidatus Buchananbacteria bacterium]
MLFWQKIPAREHYLLRLLTHLVKTYQTQVPVSIADISAQEKISVKYLEKLVAPLKKAGWVKSVRGRDGGYLLAVNPNKLSLQDVALAINRRPKLLVCLHNQSGCILASHCPSKGAWEQLLNSWNKTLSTYKLSKLIK